MSAERWRDAVVASFCTVHAQAKAASLLETAQAARDTLVALRGIALQVGDRELDESIGHAIGEVDVVCRNLALSKSRAWRRR